MTAQAAQTLDAAPFSSPPQLSADGFVVTELPRDARLVAHVNRWPLTANVYDPLWRVRSSAILTGREYGTRRECEAMTKWLGDAPGERILDVGCGSGFYLRALHEAFPDRQLHGVDNSQAFLRVAARRLASDQIPVTLTLASAVGLPFKDEAFGGVAVGGTPNEFVEADRAFREMHRVLAPEGRLWFMAAMRNEGWRGRLMQRVMALAGITLPNAGAWIDTLERAGFQVIRAEHRAPLLIVTARKRNSPGLPA